MLWPVADLPREHWNRFRTESGDIRAVNGTSGHCEISRSPIDSSTKSGNMNHNSGHQHQLFTRVNVGLEPESLANTEPLVTWRLQASMCFKSMIVLFSHEKFRKVQKTYIFYRDHSAGKHSPMK